MAPVLGGARLQRWAGGRIQALWDEMREQVRLLLFLLLSVLHRRVVCLVP